MLAAAQGWYVVEGWLVEVLHWIGDVPDLRKGFLHSATQQASARARKDFILLS